jgi:two-component system cell cycle sensor histidine kinase/response regulator CckA
MEKAVVDRIFDPYYTTKAVGEGTGMGLATVHGIVSDHGGRIFVESVPGKGSVFRFLFPVLENPAEAVTKSPFLSPGNRTHPVMWMTRISWWKSGSRCLRISDMMPSAPRVPSEALETFKAKPDGFDLVITDMTMPGMTGDQLAAEILQLRPDIPVIICTGFQQADLLGTGVVLRHPCTLNETGHRPGTLPNHP